MQAGQLDGWFGRSLVLSELGCWFFPPRHFTTQLCNIISDRREWSLVSVYVHVTCPVSVAGPVLGSSIIRLLVVCSITYKVPSLPANSEHEKVQEVKKRTIKFFCIFNPFFLFFKCFIIIQSSLAFYGYEKWRTQRPFLNFKATM